MLELPFLETSLASLIIGWTSLIHLFRNYYIDVTIVTPRTYNISQTTACLNLVWNVACALIGQCLWRAPASSNRHSTGGVRPRQTRVCVSPTQCRLLRLIQWNIFKTHSRRKIIGWTKGINGEYIDRRSIYLFAVSFKCESETRKFIWLRIWNRNGNAR